MASKKPAENENKTTKAGGCSQEDVAGFTSVSQALTFGIQGQ